MRCTNCNNEINNNATFCNYCGKSIKKKKIGAVTIISIIALALSIIATIGIIIYSTIGMKDESIGVSQGYTWFMIIGGTGGVLLIGYYAMLMVVSLICDLKLNKRTVKNIIVSIGLVLPILFVLFIAAFALISNSQKNYTIGELKVEFPEGMNKTTEERGFDGKYSLIEFYAREEEKATCSITVAYTNPKEDRPVYENMIGNSNDMYIDKDTKTNDFITNNYYRLNNRTINGVTWNYLEYNSLTTYYKIYGVSHNNGYYTFEVKDNHSSHNLCKQKEEEFINSLKF